MDSFPISSNYADGVVVTFGWPAKHADAAVLAADTLRAAAAVCVAVPSGCERPWPGALSKIILWPGLIR